MLIRILFVLFIVVPLLELYVLIEVGSDIGGIATIALCLFTAALGGILIRIQGIQTLLSAQRQLAQGQPPAEHMLHGFMLAVAGIALFLPGFLTDTVGFLLLIPSLRNLLINKLFPPAPYTQAGQSDVIDVEVIKITPKIKR